MNSRTIKGLWVAGAVSSVAVALVSYRWFVPAIPEPPQLTANPMAHPWLWMHAGLAATALLTGPWQFMPRVRARWPQVHRWLGRVYILACLVGGFAGLLLASGSTAGPIARSGFGLLALVWMGINAQGLRLALTGRYAEHRQWMIRSFSLTFAAVTLRVMLPAGQALGLPFLAVYQAAAWLSWLINLAGAELYIRGLPRPRRAVVAAE